MLPGVKSKNTKTTINSIDSKQHCRDMTIIEVEKSRLIRRTGQVALENERQQ